MKDTLKELGVMLVFVRDIDTRSLWIKQGITIREFRRLLDEILDAKDYHLLWGGRKLEDWEQLTYTTDTGIVGHCGTLFLVWKCPPPVPVPVPVEEKEEEEEEETEEEEEPNPWNEAKLLYVLSPLILLLFAFMVQMMIGGTPIFDNPLNIPTVNVTLCSIHGCATVTPAPTMRLGHTVLP